MHSLALLLCISHFAQAIPDGAERITESATVLGEELEARSALTGPFALQGDRALISDHLVERGTSRVLELRLGDDSMDLVGELVPLDPVEGNQFGRTLAMHADVALIGAPGVGHAYVFRRGSEGWEQEARLESGKDEHGGFGRAVAIEGDRALVAAAREQRGCVYAFVKNEAGWSLVARLEPPGLVPGAGFGEAIAFSGDRIVISSDPPGEGAVYAYRWELEPLLEQIIECPPVAAQGGFGERLALEGDHLLVAAETTRVQEERAGAVFTYRWKEGRWQPGPMLGADSRWFRFGCSLAVSGDTAAIGFLSAIHGVEPGGMALILRWVDEAWRPVNVLAPAGPYPFQGDRTYGSFGEALAIDGNRVLVGETEAFQSPRLWSFHLR